VPRADAVGEQETRWRCKKSHFVNITTVVATMMYDSSVSSSPAHIANTCILCLHRIYLLIMLPQSGRVTIVGSGDKTRCAQTISIRWRRIRLRHKAPCYSQCQTDKQETRLRCKKSHFVNITTVVATMMYDSPVLSLPPHIDNTCILCSHGICPLITPPQNGITTVGPGDERCAQTVNVR